MLKCIAIPVARELLSSIAIGSRSGLVPFQFGERRAKIQLKHKHTVFLSPHNQLCFSPQFDDSLNETIA